MTPATLTGEAPLELGDELEGAPALPPVTVARFVEATRLVDRIVARNVDTFAAAAERYALARRRSSSRPLDGLEAAQIAASLGAALRPDADPVALAVNVQASDLRSETDPPRLEALAAAGAATAPAFLDAVLDLVALVELPAELFRKAREEGRLERVLVEWRERELEELDLRVARARAARALAHVGEASGSTLGEALRLVERAIGTALGEALTRWASEPTTIPVDSTSSSSTASGAPTGGPEPSRSTA